MLFLLIVVKNPDYCDFINKWETKAAIQSLRLNYRSDN